MYETNSTNEQLRRRQFLAAAILAGSAVLAGCAGDSSDSGDSEDGSEDTDDESDATDDNGDVTDAGDSADFACGTLSGSPTTVDPGDRPFVFLFDYPDTWEVYNEEISDSTSTIGAFVGHSETFRGATYPINVYLNYPTESSTDEAALAEWQRPDFLDHEVIDTLEYEGESLDIVGLGLDDRNVQWRVLLPSPVGEGYHRLQLMRGLAIEYEPCGDAVDEIAMDILGSIRPNPGYSP